MARAHLAYRMQFWSPDCKKDVEGLKRVQGRFTRKMTKLGGISYGEKFDRFTLFSLEHPRLRGDLTGVYKFIRGIDRIDISYFIG